jgi:uncharacterized membrane protein YkoI
MALGRSSDPPQGGGGGKEVNAKKALIAVAAVMGLLVGAGVAYAANGSPGDEAEDASYKGSIAASDLNEPSPQELAKIDQAAAEKAALDAVPGTVLETELEADGYVVYDVEVAGDDGKTHDLRVDAGNGEILHQGLEEQAAEADGPGDAEDADESVDTEDSDDEPGDSDGPSDTEDVD